MKTADWMAYLDTLPPDHRDLAQHIMSRIQTVLNSDRKKAHAEYQHAEHRIDYNAQRISDLDLRLDSYEAHRAKDVQNEIERFAREQLSADERERLIAVLYNVVARVERLESPDQPNSDHE